MLEVGNVNRRVEEAARIFAATVESRMLEVRPVPLAVWRTVDTEFLEVAPQP